MLEIDAPQEVRMYIGPNGKPFDTREAARDALAVEALARWYVYNYQGLQGDYGPPSGYNVARWLATHRLVIQQFYRATEGGPYD